MTKNFTGAARLTAIAPLFFFSAATTILFVACALLFREAFSEFFGWFSNFTFTYFGWFYVLSVTGLLLLLVLIAAGRTGHIRLGHPDEPPAHSTLAWFVMQFAAGIGTILMFWGVAEPLSHFHNPPLLEIEPETRDAAKTAMMIALYHFGLHTWTIFILPAVALGYFCYRRDLPLRISSVFYGLLGKRIFGVWGWIIDGIALLGTLLGVAVSLGLGTLQLSSGLQETFAVQDSLTSQLSLLLVIVVMAIISVALGLERGIKHLSYLNIALACALVLFIGCAGPTRFILSGAVQNIGIYVQNLPWMSFWTEAYQGTSWQKSWTVFYWAWTISWSPYVGLFIAHISRGRSIRQVISVGLGAPFLFTLLWFSVFGLSAIDLEMNQHINLSSHIKDNVALTLFRFLDHFPWTFATSVLSLAIIAIFLTTSADSAAMVMDSLSLRADQPSLMWQRVFWMLMTGAVAASLLLGGGLNALQNVITALGFPFCLLLVFMGFALWRALSAEIRNTLPGNHQT